MSIASIVPISAEGGTPFSPALSDYATASEGWSETEFRFFATERGSFGGYWRGEPGEVSFEAWPYNEICVIAKGRVAVVDRTGARREFGAGESFFIPKGFVGKWVTIEPTEKVFVALVEGA